MPDSADVIASATGLSRTSLLELWAEAKANGARLDACPRHDFERIGEARLGAKYRCALCGGTVSGTEAHWYRQGLLHAQK